MASSGQPTSSTHANERLWRRVDTEQLITTPRVVLEPLRPTHAEELFEGLSDVALYTYIEERPPTGIDVLRERYRLLATRRSPDGSELWLNWACRERERGELVGTVQVTVSVSAPPQLGYVFVAAGQGRGLAREACAAIVQHLFDAYGASSVEATVDNDNARSIALLWALGCERVSEESERETARGTVREYRYRRERPATAH